MARGSRKTIEDKIAEKEEIIKALQVRVKAEQRELEELKNEKKIKELEIITEYMKTSKLSPDEVVEILKAKEGNANPSVS